MNTADQSVMARAQAQMQKAALRCAAMSEDMAKARQIVAYDGDRRKQMLADAMSVYLDQGESAVAAECHARANKAYGEALVTLAGQYRDAQRTLAEYEAQRTLFSSAQSVLSSEKEKIRIL